MPLGYGSLHAVVSILPRGGKGDQGSTMDPELSIGLSGHSNCIKTFVLGIAISAHFYLKVQ